MIQIDSASLGYFWSASLGYLLNETGVGRLAQKSREFFTSAERERRSEIYNVRRLAEHSRDDPNLAAAWSLALNDLSKVYTLARERDIPLVLIIFPFTFQFLDGSLKTPQAILKAHATSAGVDLIDFTEVFEDLIFDAGVVERGIRQGMTFRQIRDAHRIEIDRYFLDQDHLTPEGHDVVAKTLFDYLLQNGML